MLIPHFMRRPLVIALLAMSVLFAQMLGFVHGIAHAGWQPGAVHSLLDESLFDSGDAGHDADRAELSAQAQDGQDTTAGLNSQQAHGAHHSCAAYDAATLSAGMQFDFPPLPQLPPVRLLALWQAFASWDAPLNCHFSSRAPPR